jgi:hypothetical protein
MAQPTIIGTIPTEIIKIDFFFQNMSHATTTRMSISHCDYYDCSDYSCCLFHFMNGCADEIFKRIRNEQEGEMDEDTYYELLHNCRDEEINKYVVNSSNDDDDMKTLVESFGTINALKLYETTFASGNVKDLLAAKECIINKTLLYCILKENMSTSYRIYNNYWDLQAILKKT